MNYWKSLYEAILARNHKISFNFRTLLVCSFSIIILQWNVFVNADSPLDGLENQGHDDRKAVVVILNYCGFNDFLSMPFLKELMGKSAIGLMNVRGASKTDSVSSYASLGAGARANMLYKFCGITTTESNFVLTDIEEIIKLNESNSYYPKIGLLGDFFHGTGKKTSVIGKHDCFMVPAALLATDRFGNIDGGVFHQYIDEPDYLLDVFQKEYRSSALTVIDIGDPYTNQVLSTGGYVDGHTKNILRRVGNENFFIDRKARLSYQAKNDILAKFDTLIKTIVSVVDIQNTLLIILSPFYNSIDARNGNRLTPVIFYGKGISPGLILSDTTRRPGMIANIDIAPSIIHFFEGDVSEVTGRPVKYKESRNNIDALKDLNRMVAFHSGNRTRILRTYISIQIIVLIFILIFLLYRGKYVLRINDALQSIILMILATPVVLLTVPLLKIYHTGFYFMLVLGMDGLFILCLNKYGKMEQNKLIYISGFTCILLIGDMLCNQALNKISVLSYDAVIGARYYGIGNEYMGIFISSTLIFTVPLTVQKKLPKWFTALFYILVVGMIGLPFLGANVGGTITAIGSFGIALFFIYQKKITLKSIIILLCAVIFIVSAFAYYDIHFSSSRSHLAQALLSYSVSGTAVLLGILQRKLEMNLKLLRTTIWSRVLQVSVFVVMVLLAKRRGTLKKLFLKYSDFSPAWFCILVAGITGALVNDSGVVVTATSNIFLMFSLLYLLLEEKKVGIYEVGEDRH